MYRMRTLGFRDMMSCRTELRSMFAEEPATFAAAAEPVVQYFRSRFVDDEGRPACPLVRVFRTHLYERLGPDDRAFAKAILPNADSIDGLRCLVLMATAGDEPDWNSRERSRGHRAIPLASERVVEAAPMISQLIKQLGVEISTVLRPDPSILIETSHTSGNVFYVPNAKGSPHIVAQDDFVERYRIESVIGFGGMAASGELLATIVFSRVPISPEVADFFRVIGLNLRLALLPFVRKPLFD